MQYIKNHKAMLQKIGFIGSAVFLAAVLVCVILLNHQMSTTFLDADTSSDMVLGHLLSEEGGILSSNFYYSTELRVFHFQILHALLFHLTDDWSTVRFVASVILVLFLGLSYGYMAKQMGLKWKTIFFTTGLMLLPGTAIHARFLLFHNHYVPSISMSFLILGLLLSLLNKPQAKTVVKGLKIGFLVLISFLSGLNGVRQMLTTFAPLVLACGYLVAKAFWENQGIQGAKERQRLWMPVLWCELAVAAAFVGFLINSMVLAKLYDFKSYNQLILTDPSFVQLEEILRQFLYAFGYQPGGPALSLDGIVSVGCVLCSALVVVAAFHLAKRAQNGLTREQTLPTFFLASLFINTMVFWFTPVVGQSYYLPVIVFAIPVMALFLQRKEGHAPWLRPAAWFFALVWLASSVIMGNYFVQRPIETHLRYGWLGFEDLYLVDELTPAIEYLEENELTLGYGTFWNCNVATELSDGKIRCVGIRLSPETKYYDWLTRKDYQELDESVGEVFLLLTLEEYGENTENELVASGEIAYADDYYTILTYESQQTVIDFLGR